MRLQNASLQTILLYYFILTFYLLPNSNANITKYYNEYFFLQFSFKIFSKRYIYNYANWKIFSYFFEKYLGN